MFVVCEMYTYEKKGKRNDGEKNEEEFEAILMTESRTLPPSGMSVNMMSFFIS